MRVFESTLLLVFLVASGQHSSAQTLEQVDHQAQSDAKGSSTPSSPMDVAIDKIIARERDQVIAISLYKPIVETYVQELKSDKEMGAVPSHDHYFLGQADLGQGVVFRSMLTKHHTKILKPLNSLESASSGSYAPGGFLEEIFVDRRGIDRQHYKYDYVGREFLGDVRCVVFDLTPLPKSGQGRFSGRIWAEDHDYTIVRFNGTFVSKVSWASLVRDGFVHFDSWRLNVQPGLWLPAYTFDHESKGNPKAPDHFKSQTRLWGYNITSARRQQEFSDLTIDSADTVDDHAADSDTLPLEAQRAWQHQAESNAIDALEKAGLLAPAGSVDKVLNTVVNNLEVTNNLDIEPELRCRVLVTSTFELFSIGHTIILSRGLLDVLPDEATLATMLAVEVADAMLPKPSIDIYGFNDLVKVPTLETMHQFSFRNTKEDNLAANQKALELLRNSPYRDKLGNAGLFLEELAYHKDALTALISPRLGNGVNLASQLRASATQRKPEALDQIAALPIGGRIKLDPWDDNVELLKGKNAPLVSAREKMPFEVTPFMPHLTRYKSPAEAAKPETSSTTSSEAALRATAQGEQK
jgi:hypothetical protein